MRKRFLLVFLVLMLGLLSIGPALSQDAVALTLFTT